MKKFILFFLLGLSSFMYGQVDHGSDHSPVFGSKDLTTAVSDGINMKTRYVISSNSVNNNIEGSHYLFPDWKGKFKIYTSEKVAYSIESLNYDILTKNLLTKFADDSILIFNPDKIYLVNNNYASYKYFTINNKNELYQVLSSDNKISFLKGFDIDIVKGYFNPVTQQYEGKDKYEKKEKYFCKISGNEFIKIDLKKKPILKLFGDKSKLVEKYASDLKLSFTSEKDLSKIFQYYDSL